MRRAAPVRMRPVPMTAFSMILGVLPAAGMFSSTLLTLLVVPTIYIMLDDLSEWVRTRMRRRGSSEVSAAAQEVV
jgi:HAE1 family hydrophobic/amphiphilic exporter-1